MDHNVDIYSVVANNMNASTCTDSFHVFGSSKAYFKTIYERNTL